MVREVEAVPHPQDTDGVVEVEGPLEIKNMQVEQKQIKKYVLNVMDLTLLISYHSNNPL